MYLIQRRTLAVLFEMSVESNEVPLPLYQQKNRVVSEIRVVVIIKTMPLFSFSLLGIV